MNLAINAPELAENTITVRYSLLSGYKIFDRGEIVKRKKGIYIVKGANLEPIQLKLKLCLPTLEPKVILNGREVLLVEPLPTVVQVWLLLPLLFALLGGAIGGLLGAAVMVFNTSIFRSNKPVWLKWTLTFLNILGMVIIYVVIAALLSPLFPDQLYSEQQ
jgi:hypothetical protein